jgi:tetratricopeptide (TPR) repeat protein
MALLHQRKIDEAGGHFAEALAHMPADGLDGQYTPIRVHQNFGEALLLAYRLPEAKLHLARVVQLEPMNAQGHYWLAQALAGLGEMDAALLSYAKAMKLNPKVDDSPGLHQLLEKGLLQKRQFHEALGHAEQALALAQAEGDTAMAARFQKDVEYCRQLEQAAQQ